MTEQKTLREIVAEIAAGMRCNCDLDNWTPEPDTGHSCVCDIHRVATERYRNPPRKTPPTPAAAPGK